MIRFAFCYEAEYCGYCSLLPVALFRLVGHGLAGSVLCDYFFSCSGVLCGDLLL